MRPADLLFPDRHAARLETRCIAPPIGCGNLVDISKMSALEQREYEISLLCPDCQAKLFAPLEDDFEGDA